MSWFICYALPLPLPLSLLLCFTALMKRKIKRKRKRGRSSSRSNVTLFAMLIDVEPLSLDFRCDAQTDHSSNDCTDDRASHHGHGYRDHNRFLLFDPPLVTDDSTKTVLRRGI